MKYYAPDFELNVRSSNMENSNSREYLEKITAAVIDNLRQTGPAPSVQMQEVPRRPFGGMTDEEEAELDDLDEDENKDVRMTEHRWDKHVENGAEFEPSDDDEMASANGATRSSNNNRALTDFQNAEATENGGSKSPKTKQSYNNNGPDEGEGHDVNDDTIEDVNVVQEPAVPVLPEEDKEKPEPQKQTVDADGDVGMTDSAIAVEEAAIKEEETEPEPASEAAKEGGQEEENVAEAADGPKE